METPSPPGNRCLNICNNNLFNTPDDPDGGQVIHAGGMDGGSKSNPMVTVSSMTKHPGQAVKVTTKTIAGKEVRSNESTRTRLKNSKSCTDFFDNTTSGTARKDKIKSDESLD